MVALVAFSCSCCDRQITNPVFIGGMIYGVQCAKKVLGSSFKVKKDKSLYIQAKRLSVDTSEYIPSATYAIEGLEGKVFTASALFPLAYCEANGGLDSFLPVNALKVLDEKGHPRFKSLTVSIPDNVLMYTDKYGKKITLSLGIKP